MASNKKQIEKEIAELKEFFYGFEKLDYEENQWDSELKDLRHLTIYVHGRLEDYMSYLISIFLLPNMKSKDEEQEKEYLTEKIVFKNRIFFVLDEMEFYNKTKVIERFNLLPPKGLLGKIRGVNTLRITFSHPSAKVEELAKFKNREYYLTQLKFLNDTLNETIAYISKTYPDFYAEDKE